MRYVGLIMSEYQKKLFDFCELTVIVLDIEVSEIVQCR